MFWSEANLYTQDYIIAISLTIIHGRMFNFTPMTQRIFSDF